MMIRLKIVILFLLILISDIFSQEYNSKEVFDEAYKDYSLEKIEKIDFYKAKAQDFTDFFPINKIIKLLEIREAKNKNLKIEDIKKILNEEEMQIFTNYFFIPSLMREKIEYSISADNNNWKSQTLRYKFYKGKFSGGLVFNQDYKENWIDYYAFTFNYDNKIILGDFAPFFGQGLILGNSTMSFYPYKVYSKSSIFSKLTTNENHPFSGIGINYTFNNKIKILSFLSYKRIDGNIKDSTFTFYSSGIHVTDNEKSKKDNIKFFSYGNRLSYIFNSNEIGINYFAGEFSKKSKYLGKNFNYVSADYLLNYKKISFWGEANFDRQFIGIKFANKFGILARNYIKEGNNFINTPFQQFNNKKEKGFMVFGNLYWYGNINYFFDYCKYKENNEIILAQRFNMSYKRKIYPNTYIHFTSDIKNSSEEKDLTKKYDENISTSVKLQWYISDNFESNVSFSNKKNNKSIATYSMLNLKYKYKNFKINYQEGILNNEQKISYYLYLPSNPYEFSLENINKTTYKRNILLSYKGKIFILNLRYSKSNSKDYYSSYFEINF